MSASASPPAAPGGESVAIHLRFSYDSVANQNVKESQVTAAPPVRLRLPSAVLGSAWLAAAALGLLDDAPPPPPPPALAVPLPLALA